MAMNLVIVESPAKAKKIGEFLGKDYIVRSCFGHICDLEKKDLGIDIENNFEPKYKISSDKKSVVKELKSLAKTSDIVWLASDEDREGEAIAWHLFETLKLKKENTKRIVFHEITKPAILEAIKNPRDIDMSLVDAQQARRVLDRLVGFEVSPVLWKKVKAQLSAGRVQSVAVKLIVEREREINAFETKQYFRVTAEFLTSQGSLLKSEASTRFETHQEANDFLLLCQEAEFSISDIETKPSIRKPAPPFTTSTLQQEASRKLGFSVSQTMSLAQRLYENGSITYMRTDSVNLSKLAIGAAKDVIIDTHGQEYSKSRSYSTKSKGAQEAHEAIRPTYMNAAVVDGDKAEKQLYDLIYKRTLASQMSDAELELTNIDIKVSNSEVKFQSKGEVIVFDGFLRVYLESNDDEHVEDADELLPSLNLGEILSRKLIKAQEQYTLHPPRYTQASLVKKMETLGIGRPSTYAPTITTVQNRGYVLYESRDGVVKDISILTLSGNKIEENKLNRTFGAEKKKLFPSDIGIVVTDYLSDHFNNIMDYGFTARAEEAFDDIAIGKQQWQKVIGEFYTPFHKNVEIALESSERNTGERVLGLHPETEETVSVRIGRYGPMAQIGEGETVRYAGLLKGQLMETITMEEVLELFKFPRKLGEYEGKEIAIGIGRFGPYIRHNSVFVSLKKGVDEPSTIDYETAVIRIEEKRETDRNNTINVFESGIKVLNGRFGHYISFEKKNYKIPKTTDATTLSEDDCRSLIEKQAESVSKTKGSRAKATTKTAAKSTTKAKATTKKAPAKKKTTKTKE